MEGVGIPTSVAALWQAADPASYDENYISSEGDVAYFFDLPAWAWSKTEGPFYVTDGVIYAVSLRPSQEGEYLGFLL